jgi:SEC-C motif-containing protein
MSHCPCGSEKDYEKCCADFITGKALPKTAEQTMRSRYSAFVKHATEYIVETHHEEGRSEINLNELKEWSENSEWKGLEIIRTEKGQESDQEGIVEFKANYVAGGQPVEHHEESTFKKIDGRWFFHDAKILRESVKRSDPKVGRNDPCPCGSGKKYKKCCLIK